MSVYVTLYVRICQMQESGEKFFVWRVKSVSNYPGVDNPGDNLQETHGQSPPSYPTLIFADLCGSGVIAGPE